MYTGSVDCKCTVTIGCMSVQNDEDGSASGTKRTSTYCINGSESNDMRLICLYCDSFKECWGQLRFGSMQPSLISKVWKQKVMNATWLCGISTHGYTKSLKMQEKVLLKFEMQILWRTHRHMLNLFNAQIIDVLFLKCGVEFHFLSSKSNPPVGEIKKYSNE